MSGKLQVLISIPFSTIKSNRKTSRNNVKIISIPFSTIKSSKQIFNVKKSKLISIPFSTIKRVLLVIILAALLYFNSI